MGLQSVPQRVRRQSTRQGCGKQPPPGNSRQRSAGTASGRWQGVCRGDFGSAAAGGAEGPGTHCHRSVLGRRPAGSPALRRIQMRSRVGVSRAAWCRDRGVGCRCYLEKITCFISFSDLNRYDNQEPCKSLSLYHPCPVSTLHQYRVPVQGISLFTPVDRSCCNL